MDTSAIQTLRCQAASLLLYQSVLASEVGQAFLELLQTLQQQNQIRCLQAYGDYFNALAASGQSWQNYLITRILNDDNPFTRQVQRDNVAVSPALLAAAQHDLHALQSLYQCSEDLTQWVQAATTRDKPVVMWYQEETTTHQSPLHQSQDWANAVTDLAAYYHEYGTGIFAHRALRWQTGKFWRVPYPDPIALNQLVGYELQKETLLKNTEFLLAGYPALHVLLYGSRGSGKSSLVKALLNTYQQLRLIEVAKSQLQDLPQIVEQLRNLPHKFIIFVDDLSFEEDDDAFKALKVVLEGNLTARPQNVVVYATSNRRHLIREFFVDRPQARNEEVHAWDTMQEKLSFSDRFGLTLTFEPADQKTYLSIVCHLAALARIDLSQEDLQHRALQWATRHNGRSGRTARQFVDFLKADLAISTDTDFSC